MPSEPIHHPLAQKRGGKVYVHHTDVDVTPSPGDNVSFYVCA